MWTFLTLIVGVVGFGLAWLVHFPAPALTGPAISVGLISLFGFSSAVYLPVRNLSFVVIGISMGSEVTPAVVRAAQAWPISFLALVISIVMILALTIAVLRRLWGFDSTTAALAATPGHLSYVISLSIGRGGDTSTVAVVQTLRIFSLTLIVPLMAALAGYDVGLQKPPEILLSYLHLTVLLLASGLVAVVAGRFRLPAAFLLAGMACSAIGHLAELTPGAPPQWAVIPAYVILGCLIGSRFANTGWKILRKAFTAGIGVTVIASAISVFWAALVSSFLGISFPQALIAFAPGGVETMAAMSVILEVDSTFVAIHHIWRLLILTVVAPMFLPRSQ